MEKVYFIPDDRLGIQIPMLEREWEEFSESERSFILEQWENIRGSIPTRIQAFERCIVQKQNELYDESDFERSCDLNWEIAALASCINDLQLWYRLNQEVDDRPHT
ncbi:hypothetical protein SY83_20685 [Paenibacillus swuensis]|uniref:Radical SAM protein n=1 Tax=Paenibacillus swuensis TaxID=1178515 RepID=A0A172TMU4_9BACL|nr:hypothetical protein [Paenibacillus swuensis]ANE48302.1 hypothetical protein SY83_20685 [Paenibacillus swuensis]